MRDYTPLFPGKTEIDAACAYRNYLHDKYERRQKGEYGCQRAEAQNHCKDCRLAAELKREVHSGGCCGWSLEALPVDDAIELLNYVLAIEAAKGEKQ